MKHLIVYGHPNPKSFNNAITETFANALKKKGHEVCVRDLYALNFDPTLKKNEMEMFKRKDAPADIKTEQEHVKWADIITFIYPIWWGGPPAILKGYLERILSENFAYGGDEGGPKGFLPEKKAFTINTADAPEEIYNKTGIFKSMNQIWDDVTLSFCAIQSIGHQYFSSVSVASDEERKVMLDEVRGIAEELG